jgi:hypothetical protein
MTASVVTGGTIQRRLTIAAVNGLLPRKQVQWTVAEMSTPDMPEKAIRIGCGAVVGLVVGFALAVGTVSYYANSHASFMIVIGLSAIACGILAWAFGDRFFQFLSKWIRWF